MLIVVANIKGGAGKSTVAINLAGYVAAHRKRPVDLLDADPQRTLTDWYSVREDQGRDCENFFVHTSPDRLTSIMNPTEKNVSEMKTWLTDSGMSGVGIVDCGGFDSVWMRAAMLVADKLIIPLSPDGLNLWAVNSTVNMWTHAKAAGAKGKALFLINKAAATGGRNEEAREFLADWPSIGQLKTQLVNRVAYAETVGIGAHALEGHDKKAREEIIHLGKEVIG